MTQDTVRRLDPNGMYDAIRQFPEQLLEGRELAMDVDLPFTLDEIDHVVVVGMGGSAIGGDLLRTFALDEATIPVTVSRGYTIPGHVSTNTLVIASSYSGNTEETLSGLAQAQARDARILCLTSNGTLRRIARAHNYPCIVLPKGFQPRAALGYSFGALLTVAARLGIVAVKEDWAEAETVLPELSEAYSTLAGNEARTLAETLHGHIPIIYSSQGFLEAVNLRWRGQVEENSKTLAFGNFLPEQNHNEIMGWEREHPVHEQLAIVVLRDAGDHPRVRRRIDAIRSLLEDRVGRWQEVESTGQRKLTRMTSLLHLGDWMSFYLSVLNEVDPTPVRLISQLKETLT